MGPLWILYDFQFCAFMEFLSVQRSGSSVIVRIPSSLPHISLINPPKNHDFQDYVLLCVYKLPDLSTFGHPMEMSSTAVSSMLNLYLSLFPPLFLLVSKEMYFHWHSITLYVTQLFLFVYLFVHFPIYLLCFLNKRLLFLCHRDETLEKPRLITYGLSSKIETSWETDAKVIHHCVRFRLHGGGT